MNDDLQIKFTAHAEEQLQLRDLSREEVIRTARNPQQVIEIEGKLPVAQSRIIFKEQEALLRVVFADEGAIRWIVTVYPTSQIDQTVLAGGRAVKIKYDPTVDILLITLREGEYAISEEVAPDMIVDFDREGKPLRIEVLNARQSLNLEEALKVEVMPFTLPQIA